tara:strand:+ start:1791 stop:2051 length:261 start_codon:yes stop_codon:yes gene_type:complete
MANQQRSYSHMKTYETREEVELTYQYLMNQTNEQPIIRDFVKGYAIQRCISGCYWDFDAGRWGNGCKIDERSEWEKRHGLLEFLDA